MLIIANNTPIADYCRDLDRREITVNRDYQRSDKVWPPAARSFLIETILLGYPMPKLSLHQITDLRTKATVKEIVDGQQRSQAIFDFYQNRLQLSKKLSLDEASGKTYEELSDDLKSRFLSYSLNVDLFVAATEDEVREAFRRINSYTVPLNPEEQRHAKFQGPFKWFVHRLSRDLDEGLLAMGVFGPKQVFRMADAKLWTELADALLNGISTTNPTKLNALYQSRDVNFPEEQELDSRFRRAVDFLVQLPELHHTELMKPYQFYSLLLAVTDFLDPAPKLATIMVPHGRQTLDRDTVVANLTALAAAIESRDDHSPYRQYVAASVSRTNVSSQRSDRFRWLYEGIVGDLPI